MVNQSGRSHAGGRGHVSLERHRMYRTSTVVRPPVPFGQQVGVGRARKVLGAVGQFGDPEITEVSDRYLIAC